MFERTQRDAPAGSVSRLTAQRALTTILRIGALLLRSGASTNDVETTMRALATAEGLEGTQPTVISGLVSVSWDPGVHSEPITMIRVVRQRVTEYDRLADLVSLVRRHLECQIDFEELERGLDKIETRPRPYSSRHMLLATGASAAASTVLFGGGVSDALAAAIAMGVAQPFVERLGATGFPTFFQNVIAPAIATLVAVILIGFHLPINGPIVVTGAIMLFLPGGALVASMRDLIDGENVSGTARLAEALLLGAAVALGVALALSMGTIIGVQVVLLNLNPPGWRVLIEVIAGTVAVAFFAVRAGAPRKSVFVAAILGGTGLAVRELAIVAQANAVFATALAATVIGTVARLLARRLTSLSTIWVGAASLPLLPGLLILRGLTAPSPLDGFTLLAEALATGFAIGIGVGVGDVLISTLLRVQPVVSRRIRR